MLYYCRGGMGGDQGGTGENGTVTAKPCPKGLYGTFCEVGYNYKFVINIYCD